MASLARAIPRALSTLSLLPLIMLPWPAMACSCSGTLSPCYEVGAGAAVFTGKVISVSPAFLNRLNGSSRADASRVAQFRDQLSAGVPAQNLPGMKETFLALIPGLPQESIQRVREAKSGQALAKIFDSILNQGSYVTLEVKTVFTKGGDDDDKNGGDKDDDRASDARKGKPKDDDDKDGDDALAAGKLFSVWTPSFDCGVEFQTGETYLVYASMDEDSATVETDICMGTRRLSDAGADLPYLSFVQIDPKKSGHLDGFVTSDFAASARPAESDTISSPVGRVLIELKSGDMVRYATSGRDGRFVFDGLADDSYKLTGYTTEYPDPQHLVAGPDELKIKVKGCSRYVLLTRPG
jgi:hypothetical protein